VALSSDSWLRERPNDVPATGNCEVRDVMVRVVSGVSFRVAMDSKRSVREKMVRSASEMFANDGGWEGE